MTGLLTAATNLPGSGVATLGLTLGPVGFERPVWLLAVPVAGALVLLIARRSLAGLGGASRRVAIGVRILVISAIAAALAEPSLRRTSEDVAVIAVVDTSRSVPADRRDGAMLYLEELASGADARRDRIGLITIGAEASVQQLPADVRRAIERTSADRAEATDLAAGVRTAIAVAPRDAANRVVLISDGNETEGSVLAAAEEARASGVPIDVVPLEYAYDAEVIVERVIAPSTAREGDPVNVSVVVSSSGPARGRITLTENGEPIDLNPDPGLVGRPVELEGGREVLTARVEPLGPGPKTYEATFEPAGGVGRGSGDSIVENNSAASVTFVKGLSRTLVVSDDPNEHGPLTAALRSAGILLEVEPASAVPTTLAGLNAFDAVVLVNQPASAFTLAQQEALVRYVENSGGGLVMTGGPDSFGAGGWIGSPVEDALPVYLDPPNKRQIPRGALAIVLDASGSMGSGVAGTGLNQQQIAGRAAIAAVEALSSRDLIAVVSFDSVSRLEVELTQRGDGGAIARAIRSIGPGGGTNMFPGMEIAFRQLRSADSAVKHMIVLSDGQTAGDAQTGLQLAAAAESEGITISTIAIGNQVQGRLMEDIALAGEGEYYRIGTGQALVELPQIFIKEALTIRRSLIWEGRPFSPGLTGVPTETMRGISGLPPIDGYVVAAERGGLAQTTAFALQRVGDGAGGDTVRDPISAQWQYGLGRAVAVTTDAGARWADGWLGWAGYDRFWEQHVRWALRPTGSDTLRVVTERSGDQTELLIEALDDRGERLNFASFEGRLATPSGEGRPIDVTQTGPGRYRAVVDTPETGSYIASLRYRAPNPEGGRPLRGSVQASITRPAADEFRARESNAALLRQVASITGGRELSGDAGADNPWRREGLEQPVASRPIWLVVALAGVGLFLADVAVRRVRIEPKAIAAAISGVFKPGARASSDAGVGALRAAKQRSTARAAASGSGAHTKRKFEPESAAVAAAKGGAVGGGDASGVVSEPGGRRDASTAALRRETAPAQRGGEGRGAEQGAERGDAGGGGLSRLKQAKQRARGGYDGDDGGR